MNSTSQVAPQGADRNQHHAEQIDQKAEAEMGNNANFSHFFNAYGILKLLFKKRGEEFIGRFHDRYPITVKNPITNCVSGK